MSNVLPSTEVEEVPAKPLTLTERIKPAYEEDLSRVQENRNESSMINFEAEQGGFTGAVSRQFFHGGNIAYNLYRDVKRKSLEETDPLWTDDSKNEFLKANLQDITSDQAWRFWGTKNGAEAQMLLDDMKADRRAMKVQGELGFGANLAAGFVAGIADVDAPLMFLSGGIAPAAKAAIAATRTGRLAMGLLSGTATGVALGALDNQVNPNSTAEDIALFGVMGAGFGLVGGAFSRSPFDATHNIYKATQEEIAENLEFMTARRAEFEQSNAQNWSVDDGFDQALRDELTPPTGKPAGEGSVGTGELDLDAADAAAGPSSRAPGAFSPDQIGPSSAGAAQVPGTGTKRTGVGTVTGKQKTIADIAEQRDKSLGIGAEWNDPNFNFKNAATEFLGRKARRFAQVAQRIGIGTDHGKGMASSSPIVRMFTYDVLESPSGIARNSQSAAILKETYRTEMAGAFMPYYDSMKAWKAENGLNWTDDVWHTKGGPHPTEQFNREVITELMSRAYGGKGSSNKHVKAAADAHDAMYKLDIEIGQGRGNEQGMDAYQGMKARSGYVQQRWSGRNMQRMIEDAERAAPGAGARQRRAIQKAISEEYKAQYPAMSAKERGIIASAVVDRALTNNSAISRNLLTLLNGDEAPFIKQRMIAAGMDPAAVERTINGLIGTRGEKGKPVHTQARYDVDFRSVSKGGINMMDLLDLDLADMANRRMSKTSGLASLARKGITSREKFEEIKAAAIADQKARGVEITPTMQEYRTTGKGDSPIDQAKDIAGAARLRATDSLEAERLVDEQWFDDMYSYFNGTPIAGGISPNYARAKKLTSLALMNQLGLTQLAEYGAVAAGVGFENFMQHAGVMFQRAAKNPNSPLMSELSHFHIFVPEENVFRPDLTFETEKINGNDNKFLRGLDNMLNKGQRLQGYVSMFYAVRGAQQKMVLSAGTARLFESIKRGGAGQWSDMRLEDMGINLKMYEDLIAKGIPEFDANGRLVKMNFDKWDYETQMNFRTSMHRLTGQLIQKAMAGESNAMFHKDGMGQLFWQFKSFPLLSVEKQFARNMRHADAATLNTFIFGTITAGLAYTSRQLINGRTDNITTEKVIRGALNYSNMAGWIGMWSDPVAGLLGMDPIMSNHNPMGSGSVIPVPAAFGTLEKMAQAPAALLRVAGSPTGLTDYTNNDVRALQTWPIIGNMIGMNFALNMIKKDPKRKSSGDTPDTNQDAMDAGGIVDNLLGMN